MDRDKIKSQIEDLMAQYDKEEIDGETYFKKMMTLTTLHKDEDEED